MSFLDIISIFVTFALMIAVFVGAYYISKLVGQNYQPKSSKKSIDIIDRVMVGKDQSIVIVKVKDKVYLLGVASQQVTMLDELNAELFENDQNIENPDKLSFFSVLNDAIKNKKENRKEDFKE